VGFVYWPAVLGISIGSVLFVPVGTGLGKRIAGNILRRFFALFLFVLGITFLIH
jgi:uncharacterized membrane protein YfcA